MIRLEDICTYDNIVACYRHCRKGKRHQKDVIEYHTNYPIRLTKLMKRILNGKYKPSGIYTFVIYEPKERHITANYFEDKIVQRLLTEYVLKPILQPKLIYDNYATQDGKGSGLAIKRAKKFVYQYHKEHDWEQNGWVLSCDIKKYFYSIDQTIAMDMVRKLDIDDKLKDMLCNQIRAYGYKFNYYTDEPNRGICIGFQTSQWIAVYYLNGLDHFIKEELGIRYYGRYMDDFYLIHENKEYLKECKKRIQDYVESKLNLKLNKKTYIYPLSQGLTFIGYRFILDDKSHRVTMLIRKKSIQREYNRLKKQLKLLRASKMKAESILCSLRSWYAYAVHDDLKKGKAKIWYKRFITMLNLVTDECHKELDQLTEYNILVKKENRDFKQTLARNQFLLDCSRKPIEYPHDL